MTEDDGQGGVVRWQFVPNEGEVHAADRSHAPGVSGFWLHLEKGAFRLTAEEQHSEFLKNHCELFGFDNTEDIDLGTVYTRGWISIRKWQGSDTKWAIVYGRLEDAFPLIQQWARQLLAERPDEAHTPVFFTSLFDERKPANLTLKDLAEAPD